MLLVDGVSFPRTELYDAIRDALSGTTKVSVHDTEECKWDLCTAATQAGLPTVTLARDARRFVLRNCRLMSPDPSTRTASLDEISHDVRLPTRKKWLEVVSVRPLNDEEMDQFEDDVRNTPTHAARVIRREIAEGRGAVSSVVPGSPKYYGRLVGCYDGTGSMSEYCNESISELLSGLREWHPPEGVVEALLLSCSSTPVSMLDVMHLKPHEITKIFSHLDAHGDRLSQTGAIELGLRLLPAFPQIERPLASIITQIRDDDVTKPESGYGLLAGLFALVDGELSRRRVLAHSRPFYRRLGALSQATLVAREICSAAVDRSEFTKFLSQFPSPQFYLQNYVDMRLEPRWSPAFGDAERMKASCIGRVIAAAVKYAESVKTEELGDLFREGSRGSLLELYEADVSCASAYPGPLSATEDSAYPFPDEIGAVVRQKLEAGVADALSLRLFSDSALMFGVSKEEAERMAEILRSNHYRIGGIEDRVQIVNVAMGLAGIAAVSRSETLADQVRILDRRYRSDKEECLSVVESLQIGLTSAASRVGLREWLEFVGDWLTELAFSDLDQKEAELLLSNLRCLTRIVPELWRSCARAEAALSARIGS